MNSKLTAWRSIANDLPDWSDTGPAELRYGDGRVISGRLHITDFISGDPEIPLFAFTSSAGEDLDIFTAKEWRLVRIDQRTK